MPPRTRTARVKPAQTTEARLSSIIKAARDTMRKDAGLNGDLDRVPQIAWLLFLKALDDLEERRAILDEEHEPVLSEEYRWRTWAADPVTRRTGQALLDFVNDDLLPHLGGLTGSGRPGDPAETLAEVFRETRNRMVSGYLLYELIGHINKIDFASSDDTHTMARVYETMLREVRDAAGDSGEFYTPRPLIRFMVGRVDPRVGETVLDPAVGTGGFLVEAYEHLKGQIQSVEDHRTVERSLQGFEKKPLPFLLCQMNLLLHGVSEPQVRRGNALAMELQEQRRNGVDVVLTNPPFGGEEEASIQGFFKSELRTAETTWLFLQTIMARLERSPTGRCAVVVPNGVLFATEGAGARIKEKLLRDFNLHTVVRLPDGVFSPYTQIPSNLLFFERGTTTDVWFYEIPLEGRRGYTKTKPMRYEDFAECEDWWGGRDRSSRREKENAWRLTRQEIMDDNYFLDHHLPTTRGELSHQPLKKLVGDTALANDRLAEALEALQLTSPQLSQEAPLGAPMDSEFARIGDLLRPCRSFISIDPNEVYTPIGVRGFGRGIFMYEAVPGNELGKLRYSEIEANRLVVSNIKAWEGAVAQSGLMHAHCIASNRFLQYELIDDRTSIDYVRHYLLSPEGNAQIQRASPGSADRNRTLSMAGFESIIIPVPDRLTQDAVVRLLAKVEAVQSIAEQQRPLLEALLPAARNTVFTRR